MLWAGSAGATAQELSTALGFAPEATTGPLALGTLEAHVREAASDSVELSTANRVWIARDFSVQPEFATRLATAFHADLGQVDFGAAPDAARGAINAWVTDQTGGTIQDLLPPAAVSPQTRAILTNALHVAATWKRPFDVDATVEATFHATGGDRPVRMMRQTERFKYAETPAYRAVELPYEGDRLVFDVLLPAASASQQAPIAALTSATWQEVLDAFAFRDVALQLPTFRVENARSLAASLKRLGVTRVFGDDADFSAMTPERDLRVADVLQKTFLSVTEKGTEAGASTAVVIERYGDLRKTPFVADRPFVFLLRDRATGVVLMLGEYRGAAA
jgi:serpin B